MAEASLRWVRCRLVAGHGVASGRAATSPYPAGTIHLQAPFFAARGIDLAPFFAGTLNLEASRGHWRLRDPDARVEALEWTDRHPPETFSFWHCRLRIPAETGAAAIVGGGAHCGGSGSGSVACNGEGAGEEGDAGVSHEEVAPATSDPADLGALIYYPHPETKRAHHQAPSCLELLAPWIPGLHPGAELELGVDPRRCRLVEPARLRARLLEFLKFRVLAAQEEFFVAFQVTQPCDASRQDPKPDLDPAPQVAGGPTGRVLGADVAVEAEVGSTAQAPVGSDPVDAPGSATCFASSSAARLAPIAAIGVPLTANIDASRFRAWLHSLWPEALDLDDTDLLATLEQARHLYVN